MLKFQTLLQRSKNVNQIYLLHCKRRVATKQFSTITSQTARLRWPNTKPPTQRPARYSHCAETDELDYKQYSAQVREGIEVIDVRNPDEIEKNGKVPSALNIPLPALKTEMDLSPEDWKEKYNSEKPDPEIKIMLICASGVRSRKALDILKQLGYKHLFSYKGGYNNYKDRI